MTRLRAAAALALAAVALAAEPAAADPARPTDYRSEVTAVEPDTGAIRVEVVGGDSFLRLRAEPGHEVVVHGYTAEDPEPYLRFARDGTVWQNGRSEATYVNDDRYGGGDVPEGLSPDDEPEWEQLDDDGEHTWHDHRIHWMSPDRPPGLEPGDVVIEEWVVPLTVDGQPVEVKGRLRWVEDERPLPWVALAAAACTAVLVAARRRAAAVAVAGAALTLAGAAATAVAAAERAAVPAGAGGSAVPVAVAGLGAAAGLLALLRRRTPLGAVAALASVALLAGWALLRLAVLVEPVLPTDLAPDVDRAATAAALGVAVAAAVAVVRSGSLRLPDLEEPERT